MSFVPNVENGAFEQCVLPYEFDVAELNDAALQLDQRRVLCSAPIHEIVSSSGIVAMRTGINSDPLDKFRRTETVVTAETVFGPVAGVVKASLIIVRPRVKIENFGLPIYSHYPQNPDNIHQSYFGDEHNRVTGVDGVGVIIFNEKVIMLGIIGRKLLPVTGATQSEASNFANVTVAYMMKSLNGNGEYIGPFVGY